MPGGGRGGRGTAEFVPVPPERRGRTVRRIVAFFRPYRLPGAVVLAAILVTSFLGLVNPLMLKLLTDEVIIGHHYDRLDLYVGLMIAIPIISGLIGLGQTYLNNVIGQHIMQDLRSALYAHLQRMPLRFFTETRTGEIQSRLSNDVGGIQSVVTDTAASVTSNVAVTISTIIAMLLFDWRLTALSLGMLPFFLFLTFRVGKVRREVSSETQKSLAELSAVTEETLSVSGILLSKTFGQQAQSIRRFQAVNGRLARIQIRQAMVGRWFFMIIGTIFSITPALVYWLAGTLAAGGDPSAPTAGTIVAFTTLQSRLFFPLGQLLNVQVELQGSLALFDRIFEYLELKPEIADSPDAVALDPRKVSGRVSFRNVWFRYPRTPILAASRIAPLSEGAPAADEATDVPGAVETSVGPNRDEETALEARTDATAAATELTAEDDATAARTDAAGAAPGDEPVADASPEATPGAAIPLRSFALEDLDFEVLPGQLVALVGPSGSGKTTTTYLIPRLYDVDRGAVQIDGMDVRDVTLESLGETIGFVTQETYLFHASIRDNLRYARPEATDAELEAATRAAAIYDRIMELPENFDTTVGERGYKLSGGEKQRIAIARVLLKDPRILILDEATSALDTVSERLIQAALERLMQGRTTIAIAHRLSTILAADQILVYQQGRIVEQGTHPQLLAHGGLYARLYQEQFLTAAQLADADAQLNGTQNGRASNRPAAGSGPGEPPAAADQPAAAAVRR